MWKKFSKNFKNSESYISMGLGLLVVIVIGILLFNFFSSRKTLSLPGQANNNQTQQNQTSLTAQNSLPTTYKVAEGDTLWSISEKYLKSGYNWVDIVKANNLTNPDYLEKGQVLKIPNVKPILPVTGVINGEGAKTQELGITGNKYTVVEGDDLWNIAVRAYGDGYKWLDISKANNLENPDIINVGNVLTLPR